MFNLHSNRPELIFNSHIDEFHVLDKDTLFNDLATGLFSDFHRSTSSLYLLAKTRRIQFIPDSFAIEAGYCIRGKVKVGNRVEKVRFNVAKILFESCGVKEKFASWEDWAQRVMSLWQLDASPLARPDEKYRSISAIDLTLSNGSYLYIDCALIQAASNGDRERRTVVAPIQLAFMFDWEIFDDIEVLYVGKSTDSVLKRASEHNKWGEITSGLKQDEMALIYFLNVTHSSLAKRSLGAMMTMIGPTNDEKLDKEVVTLITEAALIKHFFKEKKFNRQIVTQPLEDVRPVKDNLVKRGYSAVQVALMLDSPLGVVGTPKTGFHNQHVFQYSLDQLQDQ
jgi:hypothetical protein